MGVRGGAVWLRYCKTSPKVVASIPDGVTMTLGSTKPLT
jgi:hypothetical protein